MKAVLLVLISWGAALLAAALAFGFLAPWFPVADSFAHFRFHLLVALAISAVALGLLRAPVHAMLAAALILPGIGGLAPALPAAHTSSMPDSEPAFTLVQLNLNFRNRNVRDAITMIREKNADVVTLQEVSSYVWVEVARLFKDYPYNVVCQFGRVGAVAVFSRLPFEQETGSRRGCVVGDGLGWIRVMVGDRPVTVASLHLKWPFPFGQSAQLDRLEAHLQALPGPVVVGGDFNAAPWSHSVNRVGGAARASVIEGLRLTLYRPSLKWVPGLGLPIDHVLAAPGMATYSIKRGPYVGSDHLPVIARLGFEPEDGRAQEQ
ncbi:endonuclease/exonuclease/phosphatase family protein [Denitrobaculum tricleocarpae]|uniref:Endonuclease/exonuclease/phosphatase domain-containing protein n=1 Tax=Denitrobaculum tricleocarpae TaxID=2591009 RepID=A0A545T3X4_9PROT|nr:endonuclease/exonuclease/phosphatase family protein [Denitrobaculum tricleocarpae]TQV71916.1 hypothetical protein FKG95_26435 [Denitrobaculum tricleocarpae]